MVVVRMSGCWVGLCTFGYSLGYSFGYFVCGQVLSSIIHTQSIHSYTLLCVFILRFIQALPDRADNSISLIKGVRKDPLRYLQNKLQHSRCVPNSTIIPYRSYQYHKITGLANNRWKWSISNLELENNMSNSRNMILELVPYIICWYSEYSCKIKLYLSVLSQIRGISRMYTMLIHILLIHLFFHSIFFFLFFLSRPHSSAISFVWRPDNVE